ncbi:unnamed protein product [Caenorhabditis auriculariae]|uniref:Uncharacterized protein n=1 Tax=Caenorhabditis auriculariae TaxID=2777116 RepID=A0A8S1H6I9_9PELO|nr:unnamed protein product [Caenorhabditis auriculariae]
MIVKHAPPHSSRCSVWTSRVARLFLAELLTSDARLQLLPVPVHPPRTLHTLLTEKRWTYEDVSARRKFLHDGLVDDLFHATPKKRNSRKACASGAVDPTAADDLLPGRLQRQRPAPVLRSSLEARVARFHGSWPGRPRHSQKHRSAAPPR